MSALRSDISTNSRFRILLTTFGGKEAARLYGPGPAPAGGRVVSMREAFGRDAVAVAAAAKTSRPDCGVAGAKTGICGSLVGSGISPSLKVSPV